MRLFWRVIIVMSLTLMYITNNPTIALIAEKNGVERIWIDLETLGKEERQKNLHSVKSHHTLQDVEAIAKVLKKSECMVRINPWHKMSYLEIEDVLSAGAKRIMLPMWKTVEEVDAFLNAVDNRAKTTLLLETKEAVKCIDQVLENELIDEIHIGLNDLHLSYGLTFMFELLSNGIVETLCKKFKIKKILYGFGGIAKIGEGMIPAEKIIMEHYRLGSTRAILSRSFCNTDEIKEIEKVQEIFETNIQKLRNFELLLPNIPFKEFLENKLYLVQCVDEIVKGIKEKQDYVFCDKKSN